MKRIISLLLIVLLFLCGCNSDSSKVDSTASTTSSQAEAKQASPAKSKADNGIDIDLTTMSSTMVYSQVSDIMYKPEKYIGQTIKIKGTFAVYEDKETGNRYYSVLISDATACCQNGMEFVPEEDLIYPDDFPEPNTEITVTGTINTYNEGEFKYLHLENSSMIVN